MPRIVPDEEARTPGFVIEMIPRASASELLRALQFMRNSLVTPWPGELCALELAIRRIVPTEEPFPSFSEALVAIYRALCREIDMRFPPSVT